MRQLVRISEDNKIYGAVCIGNIWQFGALERETKQITQDLNLDHIPADLESLINHLVGIILGE